LINFPLLIGLIGAALTTFAFIPQSFKAIKTKHTKDLSLITIVMADTGVIAWLVYGILISDIPIIAANSVSILVMTTVLILKLKYN
jgi:MtN3 and saliva related transmembrane protein